MRALCIPLLLLGAPLAAQTLLEEICIPPVGTVEARRYYYWQNPGELTFNGSGQVWEAPGLAPVSLLYTHTWLQPSGSPFAAQYPQATLVRHDTYPGWADQWHYFQVSPQVPDAVQAEAIGIDGTPIIDGRNTCVFPLDIGQSFTDIYTYLGQTITFTATYVAHGTFITPWGAVPDVVVFEMMIPTGIHYAFYRMGNLLHPIGSYQPTSFMDFVRLDITTAVPERAEGQVRVAVDAATGACIAEAPFEGRVHWRVRDAQGRTVRHEDGGKRCALQALPPGAYVLEAADGGGGRAVGRFVAP